MSTERVICSRNSGKIKNVNGLIKSSASEISLVGQNLGEVESCSILLDKTPDSLSVGGGLYNQIDVVSKSELDKKRILDDISDKINVYKKGDREFKDWYISNKRIHWEDSLDYSNYLTTSTCNKVIHITSQEEFEEFDDFYESYLNGNSYDDTQISLECDANITYIDLSEFTGVFNGIFNGNDYTIHVNLEEARSETDDSDEEKPKVRTKDDSDASKDKEDKKKPSKDSDKDSEDEVKDNKREVTKKLDNGIQFDGYSLEEDFLDEYTYLGEIEDFHMFMGDISDETDLSFILTNVQDVGTEVDLSELDNDETEEIFIESVKAALGMASKDSDIEQYGDMQLEEVNGATVLRLKAKVTSQEDMYMNMAIGCHGSDMVSIVCVAMNESKASDVIDEFLDSSVIDGGTAGSLDEYIYSGLDMDYVLEESDEDDTKDKEDKKDRPDRNTSDISEGAKLLFTIDGEHIVVGESTLGDVKDILDMEPMDVKNYGSDIYFIDFANEEFGNTLEVITSGTSDSAVIEEISIEYTDYEEKFVEFEQIPYDSTLEDVERIYGYEYEEDVENVYTFEYSENSTLKIFTDEDWRIWRVEARYDAD